MRICLVNDYSLTHIGGAVTSLLEQKNALEAEGHTVVILQLGKPVKVPGVDSSQLFFVDPSFTLPKNFYQLPILVHSRKNLQNVRAIVHAINVDVIHIQSEYSLAYAASKIAKELTIPTVYTIHTFFWTYSGTVARNTIAAFIRFCFRHIMRLPLETERLNGNIVEQTLKNITLTLAKRSEAVISPSTHQAVVLQQTSLKAPVFVIPNPYRAPTTSPKPTIARPSQDAMRIAWIGRHAPEKRPAEFLEAVRLAQIQVPQKIFVDMIGDGSLFDDLKRQYQSATVVFHGKQSRQKVVAYIDQSDITALTSYHFDNQPMTIAEATSRFRGVLYCDERLTEGLTHAGYKSTDETIQGLSAAIIKLIQDPSLVSSLSRGAQRDSTIFRPQTYTRQMTAIYEDVRQQKHRNNAA